MKDFNYWKKLYESDKLEEFSENSYGLLWLDFYVILNVKNNLNNFHPSNFSVNNEFLTIKQ